MEAAPKEDLRVLGGGVDLQDTGSLSKMMLVWMRMRVLKRFGNPLIQAFQGAGPVTTNVGAFLLRAIANTVDDAILREPTATSFFSQHRTRRAMPIRLACDAALMLDTPSPDWGAAYLRGAGLNPNAPILGINLCRWFHQRTRIVPAGVYGHTRSQRIDERQEIMIQNIVDMIVRTKLFRQIVLLPIYRSFPEPWEDDF